ncbi:MAG TPA: hypothetical protein VFG69_07810 [Nannocystaceae bacterium]|nr:hypothetical protein [Nannocystaceae bacterium]
MARFRESLALALVATFGCEVADFDVERGGLATIPRDRMNDEIEMMRLDDTEIILAELDDTHDIRPQDVADAQITSFTLTVVEPAEMDLAFVDRIEIYAEAPGLAPVRIAHRDSFPAGLQVIELETDDVDLRDYVAAPTVTLVARVDGAAPPMDVEVDASANLHLGVTLRGACNHM